MASLMLVIRMSLEENGLDLIDVLADGFDLGLVLELVQDGSSSGIDLAKHQDPVFLLEHALHLTP